MSRPARRPVDALLDLLPPLALVAGKGGVGKTTCAGALALRSAERGARTLLLSTDPAGTLGDALGVSLGAEPAVLDLPTGGAEGGGRIEAFQVDAAAERQRFLARWRHVIVTIIDRGTYLDAEDISGLVDAAMPGADEVFAVLRLGELERAARYDRILVDTAPTGHTLRLLDLPRTFVATIELLEAMQSKHRFMVRTLTRAYREDAADAFLDEMRQQTAALLRSLHDRERSAAVLITRDEPLVVAETERYAAGLAAAGIHVVAVVSNAADGSTVDRSRVVHAAPHYSVPTLPEAPVGVDGLRRWGQALVRTRGPGRGTTRAVPRKSRPAPRARPSSRVLELLAASLTIVGGKGGVGKTTTACALAVQAARPATPVLLVSTDPAPSIADALGEPIDDVETEVVGVPGLTARQMDATEAFRGFQRAYQERVDAVFDAFIRGGLDAAHDRAILRDLLALAPPGIDELYALASLGETLVEGRFSQVIVDPAPTGHLVRLLQMPALALEWTHRLMRLTLKYRDVGVVGGMGEDLLAFTRRTRRLSDLLRDAGEAGLVVVALDEPLVRGETARLVAAARAEGVSVRAMLWNRSPEGAAPRPLPVVPPVPQFVAPAATPPPVGAKALGAWAGEWRQLPEADV